MDSMREKFDVKDFTAFANTKDESELGVIFFFIGSLDWSLKSPNSLKRFTSENATGFPLIPKAVRLDILYISFGMSSIPLLQNVHHLKLVELTMLSGMLLSLFPSKSRLTSEDILPMSRGSSLIELWRAETI